MGHRRFNLSGPGALVDISPSRLSSIQLLLKYLLNLQQQHKLRALAMAARKCIICGSANAKDCKSCKSAAYCRVKCQRVDWPIHKLLCKVITAVPPRPSEDHILGIRFPDDSKNPQLVWVECKTIQLHNDENKFHDAQIKAHLGNDSPAPGRMIISSNNFRGLKIDHTIIVWCRDNFGYDGSRPNLCAIETSGGKCSYDYKGPLVALHQIGLASDPYAFYKDVTLEDLRIVVEYNHHRLGREARGEPHYGQNTCAMRVRHHLNISQNSNLNMTFVPSSSPS